MPAIEQSRILIVATDGFEQSELFEPRQKLIDAGAKVTLASPATDPIQGMQHDEKGDTITPDMTLESVKIEDYDGLVLPGGVGTRPMIARLVTDLPEPDSPTMPSVSPGWISKLTPLTAWTTPSSV